MYCPYEINPYKTQSDITHVKCLQLQKQALSRFTFVIIKGDYNSKNSCYICVLLDMVLYPPFTIFDEILN